MRTCYNLEPMHSCQKSFYGKARVIRTTGAGGVTLELFSYNTRVAAVWECGDGKTYVCRYWDGWSATTAKHVNEFFMSCGLPTRNKNQWFSLPARVWFLSDYMI